MESDTTSGARKLHLPFFVYDTCDESADDIPPLPFSTPEPGDPHGDFEIIHVGKSLPQKLLQICPFKEIARLRRSEGVVEKSVGLLCWRSLGAHDVVSAWSYIIPNTPAQSFLLGFMDGSLILSWHPLLWSRRRKTDANAIF